ncbi:MAG TPA: MFS transporter [Syntrophales bacterium]|nr:MFS transporter [Syntrophobacterales bacterium]HRR40092.1 MFS transporter [Syntrophales bacterium]
MGKRRGIYWGWYVVVGAFLVLSVNYGARYCFGVFVNPLADQFKWSRSVISLGASLNMFVYSLCSIFTGRIADRVAPRWIITVGALISSLGFVLTSFIRTPLEFYVVYGLLIGISSSGMGVVVANTSVGKWFVRKRGLAIGFATMGISFGTIVLAPTAGYIVKNMSWQAGFLFMGVVIFLIGVTLSQLLMRRSSPESYGLLPDGEVARDSVLDVGAETQVTKMSYRDMLRDGRFWVIGVSFGLALMTVMSAFVHQVAYAQDNGIERVAAASSLGAVGVAGLLGQFFFGWLSDRLKDVRYSAVLGMVVMAVGMLILLQAKTVNVLYIYALVYGFGYGSVAPMLPILAADRFGRHVLGSVYGMLTFFNGIGGSIGPIIGGLIYDRFGSYVYVWQANIAVLIVVILLLLKLKPGCPSGSRT